MASSSADRLHGGLPLTSGFEDDSEPEDTFAPQAKSFHVELPSNGPEGEDETNSSDRRTRVGANGSDALSYTNEQGAASDEAEQIQVRLNSSSEHDEIISSPSRSSQTSRPLNRHGIDTSVAIKTEPLDCEIVWERFRPNEVINIMDTDDESENLHSKGKPKHGTEMPIGVIEISDGEDELEQIIIHHGGSISPVVKQEPVGIGSQGQLRNHVQPFVDSASEDEHMVQPKPDLGRSLLRTPSFSAPSTPADIAEPHRWQAEGATRNEGDSDSWMHGSYTPEEQSAEDFSELKRIYEAKRSSKQNTVEDDINIRKLEREENARLRRLEIGRLREKEMAKSKNDEANESDDDLFIQDTPPRKPRSKKRSAASFADDDSNDSDFRIIASPRKRKSKDTSKRTRAELEKELVNNMLAGIEGCLVKDAQKARNTETSTKKSSKRRKRTGPKNVPQEKGKNKANTTTKRPRPTQAGYLNDVASLMTSNIYEDANANLGKQVLPEMTGKRKQQAMTDLIASIPLEDKKKAASEKQHILRMTTLLGSVKADGKGWRKAGMTKVLHHYQIQGAGALKARETGADYPPGGILAGDNEIAKHTYPHVFQEIIRHHGVNKLSSRGASGRGAVGRLERADIVFTTYNEVIKSYPKCTIPEDITDAGEKKAWWSEEWNKSRGLLHRAQFYRVVLDEAQAIKNYKAQTSIACRALMAKHRWAISATPILNQTEEIYPYFKFLRMPHTGSYSVFKQNFCIKDSTVCNGRLHSFLDKLMIRRTHKSTLFELPIIEMPATYQNTITLEFNSVERKIYDIVEIRFIRAINRAQREGKLEERSRLVLSMLLRLRQMTAHIFMLQETMEKIFKLEDIESLWTETNSEVSVGEGSSRDMVKSMRKMIAAKDEVPVNEDDEDEAQGNAEQGAALIFKFRKYLRQLKSSSKWTELKERSLCHKCSGPPDDPWITSCMHMYCNECLRSMAYDAAANDQDATPCVACNEVFTESHPCGGLAELAVEEQPAQPSQDGGPKIRPKRYAKDNMRWVDIDGQILPSTKTAAVQAQIEKWLEKEPQTKIIVFSQFHLVMQVLGKICERKGWGYCTYHGKMSHGAREGSIDDFENDPTKIIMIASLKCGGVGLNLTMASKVICVDLWFNSLVEQQAFCRVFRIGQTAETYLSRFVIKDTIDERLLNMQKRKDKIIEATIDDRTVLSKFSLEDMMKLFGDVVLDENAKPFIFTDDDPDITFAAPPGYEDEEEDPIAWAA